jgi:hypothetical protein
MLSRFSRFFVPVVVLILLSGSCGKKSNPIAAFEPEVVNNTDAFQFQITDASHVNTTLSYSWENTGSQATVDHSTVVNEGSAVIVILDADGTQVYSSGLKASANESTSVGTQGTWSVGLTFSNYSGTANFRLEKL